MAGRALGFGPVRDGCNSRKRMLVAGPTFALDVIGTPRYRYDTHPMLGAVWTLPVGATGLSFEGFASFIACT